VCVCVCVCVCVLFWCEMVYGGPFRYVLSVYDIELMDRKKEPLHKKRRKQRKRRTLKNFVVKGRKKQAQSNNHSLSLPINSCFQS